MLNLTCVKSSKKQTALTDINRSWLYHHTKHTTLHSLPHSKGALLAHISKSFYISYQICSTIDEVEANLDPTDFECIMEDDLLLPSNKNCSTSREHVCNCKHCATKRCNCRKLSVAPNSANVWTKQKSLLNAKTHTHSISNFKRY